MDAKMRNAPGRPSPVGPTMVSEARVTSVEESTVIYPSVTGQPAHAPTSASTTVNLRGPVVEPRQVSEPQSQGDASSVMTTTMHSGNVKVPTTNTPCSSLLNPSVEEEELREMQMCLTRYSVQFNIFPDMLQRMPNCDHVSISINNKWAIKRLLGRSDRSDVSIVFFLIPFKFALQNPYVLKGHCSVPGPQNLLSGSHCIDSIAARPHYSPIWLLYHRRRNLLGLSLSPQRHSSITTDDESGFQRLPVLHLDDDASRLCFVLHPLSRLHAR